MVTFIVKNRLNLAILTHIVTLLHNHVKPYWQNIYILSVQMISAIAKISNLYFEVALTSHVGENIAPRTCVRSLVGAY